VGEIASVGRGAQLGDAGDASRIRRLGTALSAAMLVGVSAAALDTAQAYALERRQFGVPIGSFQAIKHLLADMYVRTSLARSAAFAAAALLQSSGGTAFALDPDVATAAAGAKLLAGEAAIGNGRVAVQVLGGVGYTWAMLPHYLLKRAWVLEHLFGTSDALADAIASGLVAHAG
jgi:alkylation response protein AidB-like acyl-CoA dehydrogenase